MVVRPMLLHRMALLSVRLFCKNLGNLQEFFGQMVYRPPPPPPWQKIARTPVLVCKRLFSSGYKTPRIQVPLLISPPKTPYKD